MGKKNFLLLLVLTILVGSIFLVNYIVVKQTEQASRQIVAGQNSDQVNVQQNTNQTVDTVEGVTSEDYGNVSYDTLFDNSVLHQFKIVMTQEEWDGMSEDMLDIKPVDGNMRTGKYRKADLYYTDANGEVKVGEVGIRTKGNMSRTLPEDENGINRFHFKVKFDETFDMEEGSIIYGNRKDRKFADLSELNFKVNDGADPTNIREVFSYDLLNDFEVTAPKASMATLTFVINGVEHDFGVVRYIESVDKDFLTQRYGKGMNDGNLYKCLWQNYGPATLMPIQQKEAIGIKDWSMNYRPTYDLKTNKDNPDNQRLIDFIYNLNKLEGDELKAYLEDNFCVNRFIKAQALDVLLGEIDGYWSMGNNYYLYFNEDGIIEWIPFDHEHVLAAGWDGDPYWSYEGIATADIYTWNNLNSKMYDPDTTHPLIDKILAIDEYKKIYEEDLRTLINPANNYFSYTRFMELYHELYGLYGSCVDNEMQQGNIWELSNEEWYFNMKIDSVTKQLN
ncbi:MAG TPA: CotH kinase family protein [Mobilitalea sp.]|nr:CotH kinase family protein [Mobilitalea sp.]